MTFLHIYPYREYYWINPYRDYPDINPILPLFAVTIVHGIGFKFIWDANQKERIHIIK